MGQSDETRRRHADNIAEAIAAGGGNGGFAHSLEGAEVFSLNCVLPAFSNAELMLARIIYSNRANLNMIQNAAFTASNGFPIASVAMNPYDTVALANFRNAISSEWWTHW
ncbi:MAG: hypothetical protein KME52_14310 [Desmonostoc geniculatum HA4340-LM1]|nr:hypothetical protein [Desmonostoc geniculatum HA4340-LM1]